MKKARLIFIVLVVVVFTGALIAGSGCGDDKRPATPSPTATPTQCNGVEKPDDAGQILSVSGWLNYRDDSGKEIACCVDDPKATACEELRETQIREYTCYETGWVPGVKWASEYRIVNCVTGAITPV